MDCLRATHPTVYCFPYFPSPPFSVLLFLRRLTLSIYICRVSAASLSLIGSPAVTDCLHVALPTVCCFPWFLTVDSIFILTFTQNTLALYIAYLLSACDKLPSFHRLSSFISSHSLPQCWSPSLRYSVSSFMIASPLNLRSAYLTSPAATVQKTFSCARCTRHIICSNVRLNQHLHSPLPLTKMLLNCLSSQAV